MREMRRSWRACKAIVRFRGKERRLEDAGVHVQNFRGKKGRLEDAWVHVRSRWSLLEADMRDVHPRDSGRLYILDVCGR